MTLKLRKLFIDENAVSPVIGVILMVAITVILAAVIGTFVLGLGQQVQQTTPQTTFGFEYDTSNKLLTITQQGGNVLDTENSKSVTVKASDASANNQHTKNWGLPVSAGDTFRVDGKPSDTNMTTVGFETTWAFAGGDEVSVIWTSPSGSNSAVLRSFEIP